MGWHGEGSSVMGHFIGGQWPTRGGGSVSGNRLWTAACGEWELQVSAGQGVAANWRDQRRLLHEGEKTPVRDGD